jgi:hypothetical protein
MTDHEDRAHPLLSAVLPEIATELVASLKRDGRDELAASAAALRIQKMCGCGDDFCSSVWVGNKKRDEEPIETIAGESQIFAIDLTGGEIRYLEILYSDSTREALGRSGLRNERSEATD